MEHVNRFDKFKVNEENEESFDTIMSRRIVKQLHNAIENLGKPRALNIHVSAQQDNGRGIKGIGSAMQTGEYINLSEEPMVLDGIHEALMRMIEVEEEKIRLATTQN